MESRRICPCIKLPLEKRILEESVDKAKDYMLMHGVSMHSKTQYNRDQVQLAPFMLLPTCFPRNEFEKAKSIQEILNELMHNVAHDKEFLHKQLESAVEADDFTARLFDVYKTACLDSEIAQPLSLGLVRSDYMLAGDGGMKIIQIELNTIASSFGGLASEVTNYHRYILKELDNLNEIENIPENNAAAGLAQGLYEAWLRQKGVILFVVEEITYNICDQRSLEYEVCRLDPKIKVIRRSFRKLMEQNARLGPNKQLIVGEHVVSVVYYRTGYDPESYPSANEWALRLKIEKSRAIKCPSIQYHLAGSKKIQEALAQPGVLTRFLSQEDAEKVKDVFTGLYSLEFNEHGDKALAMAIADPTKYVLKPQREGGGNNIYGEEVRTELEKMKNQKERTGWILMNRINPPIHTNYLIHSGMTGELVPQDLVSELGIYGIVLGAGCEKPLVNKQVGHVLRTKCVDSNEGGIIVGSGALDSPCLVD